MSAKQYQNVLPVFQRTNRIFAQTVLLCATLLWMTVQAVASPLPADTPGGFLQVNQARQANGLAPFKHSPVLQQVALSHSRYLARNTTCGHGEREHLPDFAGTGVQERSIAAGYAFRGTRENVSCSPDRSAEHATEGLMGAIYHRFAFLDFGADEAGMARVTAAHGDKMPHKFTYVTGNSGMHTLCLTGEKAGSGTLPARTIAGRYYHGFCRNPALRVHESVFQTAARSSASAAATEMVVYPWPGQHNVPPAFTDNEVPDPTPSLKLSGLPVSVQFDPARERVSGVSLRLQNETGQEVELWRLDATTDPHHMLSEHEFAWFPVRPLQRAQTYKAHLIYHAGSHCYEKKWSFRTREYAADTLLLAPENTGTQTLFAKPGKRVNVVWPHSREVVQHVSCLCRKCNPGLTDFDTAAVSVNTTGAHCELKNEAGERVRFSVLPAG